MVCRMNNKKKKKYNKIKRNHEKKLENLSNEW